MIPLTLAQVAAATGGTVHPADADTAGVVVDGAVVTDSRQAGPGSLYVARVGENADGHDYCAGAAERGAVAALTTRVVPDLPCVVVPDTQDGFADLARAVLARATALRTIGVTGSSGKTSTKDLLGEVLQTHAPTVAPVGSLNSEVGVPLTVCRIDDDTRFLVVEMGARGLGHIAYLTEIAPPSIGVVLNVGTAHVGEFGSKDVIAVAKSELVRSLPDGGLAVLNADDPAVRAMADVTAARVLLVGESEDAQVRATDVALDDSSRPSFTVHTAQGSHAIVLPLVGRHHVGNALAVIAVALECGLSLPDVAAALERVRPPSRYRMEVTTRDDDVVVVNDAYNANPDSMRAALAAVGHMSATRRWAVLGSMLELGDASEDEHAGVGLAAVERHLDEVLAVGPLTRPLAAAARAHSTAMQGRTRVRWVADADAAEEILRSELAPGDVVLVKSSNGAGLRFLGERIASVKEETS